MSSYRTIVDLDASEEEAEHLAEKVRDWLVARGIIQRGPADGLVDDERYAAGPGFAQSIEEPELAGEDEGWSRADGLEVKVGRTVFFAVGVELTCRACGRDVEPEDEAWGSAVDAWYEGDDTVTLPCPHCGHAEKLTEWDGPYPWAFANLGFEFWNWPPLSERFVREVAEQLGGHRVRLVCSDV